MAQSRLDLKIVLKDQATRGLGKLGNAVDKANKKLLQFAKFAVAGVAGALALSVKKAVAFETKMGNISTLIAGDTTGAVNKLRTGILELTKVLPKDAEELGAAGYQILSAGITDTTEALDVLKQSTRLSVGGLGTVEEAADILTSSLNAFKLETKDADKVADTLFKTVKAGKTTVRDLAVSFGNVAPAAEAAGISLEEMQAATAALTTTGLKTSTAQERLRALFDSLTRSTGKTADAVKNAGIENVKATIKTSGFKSVLDKLLETVDGDVIAFKNLFDSVEAGGAALGIVGPASEAYIETLKSMKSETDELDTAVKEQQKTFANQFQLLKNNVSVVMIELGNAVLPALLGAVELLKPEIEKLTKFFEENKEEIQRVASEILTTFINALIEVTKFVVEHKDEILILIGALVGLKLAFTAASLINGISTIIGLIGSATTAISAAGGLVPALGALSGVLLSPFVLVLVGFALLATITKQVDDLRDAYIDLQSESDRALRAQEKTAGLIALIDQRNKGKISEEEFQRRRAQFRAEGGPVTAGKPFIVGEEGPELFIPRQSGQIISNDRLRGNGDVHITINGNIQNNDGLTVDEITAQIARQLELSRQGGF